MAKDSSFDVVSEVDRQEVDNALNQASKEIHQRFDFKGTGAEIVWTGELTIEVRAKDEGRVQAALEVLKEKCVRRNVSLKALQIGKVLEGQGGYRLVVTLNQGISDEKARTITKTIKAANLKGVQVAIQGDQLRVSAKSKDQLQDVIQLLKDEDFGIPLQFTNYR